MMFNLGLILVFRTNSMSFLIYNNSKILYMWKIWY